MPSGFSTIGAIPDTTGMSTELQIETLKNYIFVLLENLRYILYNLSADNFNAKDLQDLSEQIISKVVISQTVITNEIYSDYGAVADLAVDELRSDIARAQRYINEDTSPLDWLHIHDNEIDFITGNVVYDEDEVTPLEEQLHHGDRYFWWTNSRRTTMTSLEMTPYPVMVYQYNELLKGTIRFVDVQVGDVVQKLPLIVLGAGYGHLDPDEGRFFIRKALNGAELYYKNTNGNRRGVYFRESNAYAVGPWEFEQNVTLPDGSVAASRQWVLDQISDAISSLGGGGE